MAAAPPVHFLLQGPATSSAHQYLSRITPIETQPHESDLLKSIRTALRGIDAESVSEIQSASFLDESEPEIVEELTWNAHTAVLSQGGVMKKKWNFQEWDQTIQWACIGLLKQTSPVHPSTSRSSPPSDPNARDPKPGERPTFGPFAHVNRNSEPGQVKTSLVRGVFIFLRTAGRIFLKNGDEYTFALPFAVRKAWPLSPHGVMIQRALEFNELAEAERTGDPPLPTIFTITSPFVEPAAVGSTEGIIGAFRGQGSPTLKDEDKICTKPLKPVDPTEMVVWVSQHDPSSKEEVIITVDVGKNQLSVWRYAHIKPKDMPLPLTPERADGLAKKRQSLVRLDRRRSSALFSDMRHPLSPTLRARGESPTAQFESLPEFPPLSALPGMPPALSTTTTMASLVNGGGGGAPSQWTGPVKGRRNSLSRNDLSMTMDRMVLGGKVDGNPGFLPIEHGRMTASYWMERIHTQAISPEDARSWKSISVAFFDDRHDGVSLRSLLAVCVPHSQSAFIFSISPGIDSMLKAVPLFPISAISVTSLRATRSNVWDLLVVKPTHELALVTHGTRELPIQVSSPNPVIDDNQMQMDTNISSSNNHGPIVAAHGGHLSAVTIRFLDGHKERTTFDLIPRDNLVSQCFQILSLLLPADYLFALHSLYLQQWSANGRPTFDGAEFEQFSSTFISCFLLPYGASSRDNEPWSLLGLSPSHDQFASDIALAGLELPPTPLPKTVPSMDVRSPNFLMGPALCALHTLAENFRLRVDHYHHVIKLIPVICEIARIVRPEWVDYWKRLCFDVVPSWPSPATTDIKLIDDKLPVWPPDFSAILFVRVGNLDWHVSWDMAEWATRFGLAPAFAYGQLNPLSTLLHLTEIYKCLADEKAVPQCQKRAQNATFWMVNAGLGLEFLSRLPVGIAAPIREAARTCQLAPPGDWPLAAYRAIGRNDLAASAEDAQDMLFNDGYKPAKEFINPSHRRKTIGEIVTQARASVSGEVEAITGVELDLADFTDIRFGQDKRLEEVARMLCSSKVANVKWIERPDLNEHDQAKEYQNLVIRIAERTLSLPFGRAMFTFGSVSTVTREAYTIPKVEYSIRVQPANITVTPEPGKTPLPDSLSWGDFHNGVAAGLRISPYSKSVESSWIAFNKPSELTPEHAGFLLGLGLSGHLREMLTWHTFAYLTPKHDLTSIGVLLGLSAANIGSGDSHVTKLLAVHTPALLPTPTVDLNVSLVTQAAGIAGVGLLYLGSKNRRMAEVCLSQICRKDLVQPDLSNEHRESYTYAAGLAFGMVMLGKGSSVPADAVLVSRMTTLIHGDLGTSHRVYQRPFDINLTSPSATLALGLMYMRTERQDIADILTIPDTVIGLNRIQPSFVLIRTIARSLIMWDAVSPDAAWLVTQLPLTIQNSLDGHVPKPSTDDALELAYYNILAGSCFAIGLKYAGTARESAYTLIVRYFDLFTRLVYTAGPHFEHKIKRSAFRDGLNLISISLCMVMAGTGEISCFRRLRYAFGMSQQNIYGLQSKYGSHVSTHMSIGLLFLGGGRFTLGTSDAAIACMIAAFFPRAHHVSSDNKSYLQALRHLWVLAVEPRCLIARDVDSTEVVYLPVKITMKEGKDIGTTQLISPTLIPDLDKLLSIRVDTPRYWPFYLDTEHLPRHRRSLLRSQTLFVKRRTAFLSYTEDARGSRSLFVRSGASAGEAGTLDFPQSADTKVHPAGDLGEFITSFSNDVLFLAFADHFARETKIDNERHFQAYCHAALLDSILGDKPQTLQTHLTLFLYRKMSPKSRYFHLYLQDLRFAADFYSKVYDRSFSGRTENNFRASLIRDSTLAGALQVLDEQLDSIRTTPQFISVLGKYALGETLATVDANNSRNLAWYLLRNSVPVSTLLVILNRLAQDAHTQCLGLAPPQGTKDAHFLDTGIKEVVLLAGTKMTTTLGSGWSAKSLDEIIETWKINRQQVF